MSIRIPIRRSRAIQLSGPAAQGQRAYNFFLDRLQSLTSHLDELQTDASLLTKKVSNTAKTAERVGSKVRSLDEEMGRVREAGERVGQVMELKASIDAQDWESATRHCARAMSVPAEVISGPFAEMAVPTAENHLPPPQTLQTAREKLLSVFRQNFAEAASARDSNATSRFFKLFPSVGWEAEGLDAYATFVVELVRVRSPASAKTSSPLYYITALTSLFEGIAMIVDQHQPVVEKYYGPGKMKNVVRRLLEESDRVTKTLKEGWEEDRAMQRKLGEVLSNPPVPMFSSAPRRQPGEETAIDPREIDKVLSEVAAMIGRWNLFKKFLSQALKEDTIQTDTKEDEVIPAKSAPKSTADEVDIIATTASQTLFEQLVTTYYVPLETWYTRTIVDKQLRDIIDRDYAGVIKRKSDDVYKNYSTPSNVRPDRVERENRVTFIILLNDFDVSITHLERLIRDLCDSALITQHFIEEEQSIVKEKISSLSTLTTRLKSSLRSGIEQLFNQLLRPKLRTFIPDIYKDISYVLDEDGYATADYQDLTRKRFIKAWEGLDTFSEGNYRLFIGLALDVLLKPWEKFVMGLKYTELGAVRFDPDLDSLNLDSDEDVDEFYNGSGISWKIGPHEARAIASLNYR
ncbi:COG4 transport protein-domain-containing protein [Pholiota molesta]|nr:COG4 transport protein-domain-containing protein [Pholiota molesta]